MDTISRERRSRNMSRIRSKDTSPELIVRHVAHRLGYRYRLYRKDLPGNPDLVFPGRRKVVLVHGCFWHQHARCIDGRVPKTNLGYWAAKLQRNVERDQQTQAELRIAGWSVLTLWECETKDEKYVARALKKFLGG